MLADAPRPNPSPVLLDTFTQLEAAGLHVVCGFASELVAPDEVPEASLYLFKSRSPRWFLLARRLHAEGRPLLDGWPARQVVRDKLACVERLRAHGLLVPTTCLASSAARVKALLEAHALVLKPRIGGAGENVRFLPRGGPFDGGPLGEDVLAQERVETQEPDTKLYLVGDSVFAAKKWFGPGSTLRPGAPFTPRPDHIALARAVSEAVGARLLGIDVVEGPAGPVVVDVNWFPSYRSFPEASRFLAALVLAKASG